MGTTRLLRAAKNRYGSTDEVGVLEMRSDGLVEVADASRFFLESEQPPVAGSAITIALEGTRPLAVEIQALVAPAGYGSPRRATTGIDVNRVLMLIAVLARHAGLNLTGHDVYVNVAGGLRIEEPAADLAVAAALASSLRERAVREGTVLAGELSLSGRLRPAARAERRHGRGGAPRLRSHGDRARARRSRRAAGRPASSSRRPTCARRCARRWSRTDRPRDPLLCRTAGAKVAARRWRARDWHHRIHPFHLPAHLIITDSSAHDQVHPARGRPAWDPARVRARAAHPDKRGPPSSRRRTGRPS